MLCCTELNAGENMNSLIWLWAWFIIGELVYILKRAYYLVTGPSPVANNYTQFLQRCWPPLLVRGMAGAGVYWLTFYPEILSQAISLTGLNWQLHSPIPHYAVVAFFFGMGMDSILDFGLSKIPYLKDWLPQMPPPLPKAQIADPPPLAERKHEGA
jgi:hypothetical protein